MPRYFKSISQFCNRVLKVEEASSHSLRVGIGKNKVLIEKKIRGKTLNMKVDLSKNALKGARSYLLVQSEIKYVVCIRPAAYLWTYFENKYLHGIIERV